MQTQKQVEALWEKAFSNTPQVSPTPLTSPKPKPKTVSDIDKLAKEFAVMDASTQMTAYAIRTMSQLYGYKK